MYTLDTNTLIYYLKAHADVTKVVNDIIRQQSIIYVSTITELELFSLPSLTDNQMQEIDKVLSIFMTVPVDSRLARVAAGVRRENKLKTPDSVIAATAILTSTILITRNVKDFKSVSDLKLKKI